MNIQAIGAVFAALIALFAFFQWLYTGDTIRARCFIQEHTGPLNREAAPFCREFQEKKRGQ